MPRPAVTIPDTFALDWVAIGTERDGNVPGPVAKELAVDPETQASTVLLHCPPGWRDPQLDWHPTVEEAITLSGSLHIGNNVMANESYLFRPAGVLHGPVHADDATGATFMIRFDGESRILRYDGDTFPHRHAQPITDHWLRSPYTWVEKLETTGLPFLPAPEDGPWAGARYKWLNRQRETGGGVAILELSPGFAGRGSEARGQVEELVLEGSVDAGGERFVKWGYACRDEPAGGYWSDDGARLVCFWERDELAAG